jgi:beta-phosphoglucomutase-like phosphatase (HAD superfamily)
LEAPTTDLDDLTVPGARNLLDALKKRGIQLYLASGTDHNYVIQEAELLRIDHYFDGGVYRAQDNYEKSPKQS